MNFVTNKKELKMYTIVQELKPYNINIQKKFKNEK